MDATLVSLGLLGILFVGTRARVNDSGLSINTTQMLKGVAMFLIVLAHLGWFLLSDNTLLQPWSNYAGIGVDIFLFLSGYGLLMADFKRTLKPSEFYRKRLLRLFIPLWLVLVAFFVVDKLALGISYSFLDTIQSFFGIFNSADIYKDINSPLWYFTFILLYYLTFPWVVRKGRWWLAVLFWVVGGYAFTHAGLNFFEKVNNLHSLHYLAFPLGVFVAGMQFSLKDKIKLPNLAVTRLQTLIVSMVRMVAVVILLIIVKYLADLPVNSSGTTFERQLASLGAVLIIMATAILLPLRLRVLEFIGWCSFEIYLIHWPLALRYDIIFKHFSEPLAVFFTLSWLFSYLPDLNGC